MHHSVAGGWTLNGILHPDSYLPVQWKHLKNAESSYTAPTSLDGMDVTPWGTLKNFSLSSTCIIEPQEQLSKPLRIPVKRLKITHPSYRWSSLPAFSTRPLKALQGEGWSCFFWQTWHTYTFSTSFWSNDLIGWLASLGGVMMHVTGLCFQCAHRDYRKYEKKRPLCQRSRCK